jgi:hypothetical protein
MSEAATSPAAEDTSAPGVATEAPAANETDDLSTDHLDRIEAEDEDEAAAKARKRDEGDAGVEGDGAEGAEGKRRDVGEDGLVDIELNGKTYKLPPEIKDRVMADLDYRQKTTALATERKAFETETQTLRKQAEESRAALPEEYAKVAVASREVTQAETSVAEFEKIDWATWRAQTLSLPDDDPNKVNYRQYRAAYDAARETLTDAQRELGAAKTDLTSKEQTRLTEQQQAHETALASARQQTGDALKSEGWDQQRFANVASFAATEFGVTPEELLNVTDPRTWRMADMVMSLRADVAKLSDQLKKTNTAESNLKAQASRPAEPAKGNAQPTRPRDDNSTETWMDKRNRQVAAKQAAARAAR